MAADAIAALVAAAMESAAERAAHGVAEALGVPEDAARIALFWWADRFLRERVHDLGLAAVDDYLRAGGRGAVKDLEQAMGLTRTGVLSAFGRRAPAMVASRARRRDSAT
jgi:hypothetical protein